MNAAKIKAAVSEAERFLARAKEFEEKKSKFGWDSPKESGALRRSSLDLTRALADMRKPEDWRAQL